ncbi:DNA cytosine methyltransferase [Streptomyces flavofungini]|uniref:DNA cytosine methyltransferase n=1 Tax=Streptomyces flavofungini TaxID=68200 RepID=UPI0025B066E7|nr:DNA cytosine methyltransferase [Streptomyces flavofungini]WJV48481.1 DNA cytosine methyltransferase [Streptomyces flavofungini]
MPAATPFSSLEVCAGAGGLALGLESAGFSPVALVDTDETALTTLFGNRPSWSLIEEDLRSFDPQDHPEAFDVDLLSAGTPRVKSIATINRPGDQAERELVTAALYLVGTVKPRAVLFENVPGLVDGDEFGDVRAEIEAELTHHGYRLFKSVLNAMDFGVAQDRKHGFFVALRESDAAGFRWPTPLPGPAPVVGDVLHASMAAAGWPHADAWAAHARRVAPTLVGGSDRRGGPDLGPERAKAIWERMGINGGTVADDVPGPSDGWALGGERRGLPALTVAQAALLQGFPPTWQIAGRKTRKYRQVGQAVPPPLASALGRQIAAALTGSSGDSSPAP